MAKYKLTNKAVEDLSKIWNYTYEFWSEEQADAYYDSILSGCDEIARGLRKGKIYEEVSKKLLGSKVNRHIIFYRATDKNYVEITRILHERMDLRERVSE